MGIRQENPRRFWLSFIPVRASQLWRGNPHQAGLAVSPAHLSPLGTSFPTSEVGELTPRGLSELLGSAW